MIIADFSSDQRSLIAHRAAATEGQSLESQLEQLRNAGVRKSIARKTAVLTVTDPNYGAL
jgi:hypothetical protein